MFFNAKSKASTPIKTDAPKPPNVQPDAGMTPPSTPRKTQVGEATPNPKKRDFTSRPNTPQSR